MKNLSSSFLFILLAASFGLPLSAQDIQIESFQGRDVASGEIIVRFRGATQLQSQTLAMRDADILSADPVGRSGALRLRSRNRNATALLQAYNARLDVLYAEPNYVGQYFDFPNDASLGQQWGIRNTGQVINGVPGTAGADVKATQAWDITEGSRSIVVGVVDSGVDYRHPDLAANMWSAPTAFTVTINGETITCAAGTHGFSSRTRTCDPLDDYGHGTHVAGIIGAAGNNGIGVAGVSRIANIMALKLGALGSFTTLDVIATLDFVMQVKALFPSEADIRVLNASWGQPFSQALRDEIDLLNTQGILFVAAAGNAASNNDLVASYPATFDSPNIISVAATDNRDALASFSQWGPTTVDLGAPGVNVLSTMMSGNYGLLSGTSMASPMVAGAAALVLSACPMSTPALKDNLLNSADEVPALAQRTLSGGRLNVLRALEACAGSPAPTFTFTVSPGTQNVDLPGSTTLTVTSTALGGFSSAVHLSVSGLPVGMSATFDPPPVIPGGSGSATLTIAADATLPAGSYAIGITGTSGPIERRTAVVINAGPFATPILPGQTISRVLSPNRTRPDFYSLTLNSAATVTIDMKSLIFDAFLIVRNASGTIVFSDDNSGGLGSARITASLNAGTYLIEATNSSFELDGAGGKYSLSINTPTLAAFTPLLAQPGATINATLTGTRFISPMTIDAGSGITVSNVNVTSPTSATATFTIAANAVPGPRDLTVTTSDGTSNPMMYPIPTRIDPGQKISGSLEVTDLLWPNNLFRYNDLYLLTIDSSTQGPVTIEVISTTDFDSAIGLYAASGANIQRTGGVINATLSAGTYFMEVTSNLTQQLGGYVLSVHLPGLTAINPRFVEQGASVPVTFTGSRFVAPMTVDAGDNIVAGAVTVTSSTSATATLNISAAAAPGIRDVTISTPQGTSNAVPLRVFRPFRSINLGDTISGTLAPADLPSLLTPGPNVNLHYTHLYRFTLAASTQITVTLQSTDFDPFLYLVNGATGGTQGSSNDSAGDHNSRITTPTLAAGTYYLDVTSFLEGGAGDYTISLEPAGVGLTTITPRFGGPGSTFNVTLSGLGFAAPMTINAGPDISVTNVSVVSATSASATFTIAAGATPGVRDVTVTTPLGTTTALPFTVYEIPSINLGETKSGTLSIIDRASLSRPGSYGDLYRFVLSAPTSVAIDLKSTDFNAFVYLLSTSGLVMFSDDSSGGGTDARISANLAAGTYFIETTSATAGLGNYTISTVFNPPTLYFPRVLAPSDLPLTGFAITNPGGVDATVTFTMYDEAGLVVATSNETIPARAQFSKLAVDIFPTASRAGWVQAKSDVAGVKGFWLGGDWANVMDGAESAAEHPPSVDLVFPIVTPQTELNVVNLGSAANNVVMGLFGTDGVTLTTAIRSIPANGAFKSTVAAIFPSANLANAYSMRVVGNQRLTGTTVASNYPAGPSWIVMNGTSSAVTANQANFPQVVSGQSWNSILWVSSISTFPTQTLTLTFTPVTGSPITVTRTLTGVRASLRESVQTLFGLSSYQEGWVRVIGQAPLAAFLAYGFGTASAVDQGQSTSRTSMIFSHVANGPGWSTGLALLNSSTTTDANVEVYIMRKAGNLVGSASFVLPRGTKIAKHLSELVPASTANDGFVFVRTTNGVPLFGFQVFFTRDLSVFANIPASGLDPGTIFVPPTQ